MRGARDVEIAAGCFKSESVRHLSGSGAPPERAKIELHVHIKQNAECLLDCEEIVSGVFTVDSEISACIHFHSH